MKVIKTVKAPTYTVELTQDEMDILASILGQNTTSIAYNLYSDIEDAGGDGSKYVVQYDGSPISYELVKA